MEAPCPPRLVAGAGHSAPEGRRMPPRHACSFAPGHPRALPAPEAVPSARRTSPLTPVRGPRRGGGTRAALWGS